jgi:hypothetical protein
MIELVDGFWINPAKVTVIKANGKDSCTLWVRGQSAMDGFVLDYSADEVVELLHDALYGEEENTEVEEEKESDDGDD